MAPLALSGVPPVLPVRRLATFFDLSPELRNIIWEWSSPALIYLRCIPCDQPEYHDGLCNFNVNNQTLITQNHPLRFSVSPAMVASRQFYEEAWPYHRKRLYIVIVDSQHLRSILAHMSPRQRNLVFRIQLASPIPSGTQPGPIQTWHRKNQEDIMIRYLQQFYEEIKITKVVVWQRRHRYIIVMKFGTARSEHQTRANRMYITVVGAVLPVV